MRRLQMFELQNNLLASLSRRRRCNTCLHIKAPWVRTQTHTLFIWALLLFSRASRGVLFFFIGSGACHYCVTCFMKLQQSQNYHNSNLQPQSLFSPLWFHLKISINPWQQPHRFSPPPQRENQIYMLRRPKSSFGKALLLPLPFSSLNNQFILLLALPLGHIIHNILLRRYADDILRYLPRKPRGSKQQLLVVWSILGSAA